MIPVNTSSGPGKKQKQKKKKKKKKTTKKKHTYKTCIFGIFGHMITIN
jgi:hypothetical protein